MKPRLPHFLVVGTGKSGTSSLHEYLRQHPAISLPVRKETHFFVCDKDSPHPMTEYQGRALVDTIDNLDDYLNDFEQKEEAYVFGEVCPTYLFYPYAADNIKRQIPDAKIICILRNPADRLYSNYNFNEENNSLEEFLALINSLPVIPPEETDFTRWVQEGFYYLQVHRYFELFPAENIKVYLFDELMNDPDSLMKDLIHFLNLPDYHFNTSLKFNTSGNIRFKWLKKEIKRLGLAARVRKGLPIPVYQFLRDLAEKFFFRHSATLPQYARVKLQDYYADDVMKLQALIKKDLSSWLNIQPEKAKMHE